MASFSVALRQLSSSCEFGAFLPEALRDHFGCGLSNQGIQIKLSAEANVTLDTTTSYGYVNGYRKYG